MKFFRDFREFRDFFGIFKDFREFRDFFGIFKDFREFRDFLGFLGILGNLGIFWGGGFLEIFDGNVLVRLFRSNYGCVNKNTDVSTNADFISK